jgi:hypothetical protein
VDVLHQDTLVLEDVTLGLHVQNVVPVCVGYCFQAKDGEQMNMLVQ